MAGREVTQSVLFWQQYATVKSFKTPDGFARVSRYLAKAAKVVDLGCGYGRTLNRFASSGYTSLVGVDFSDAMLREATRLVPAAQFIRAILPKETPRLRGVDCVMMLTVLNSLSSDDDARELVAAAFRMLRPGGLVLIDDYPIIPTAEYLLRYSKSAKAEIAYGTFAADGGEVFRHRPVEAVRKMVPAYARVVSQRTYWVPSMNGRRTKLFSLLLRKSAPAKA